MGVFIYEMVVSGIVVNDDGTKCFITEKYDNYTSENVDFWSGEIKTITNLEFGYIYSDGDSSGIWEFIETNSQWLSSLESITFSQSLGECDLIDNFHDIITSKYNVYCDITMENKIVYSFLGATIIDKVSLGNHLMLKTITSIY